MDVMNSAAPAAPFKEVSPGQAAIDEAEKTLADFKVAAAPIKEEAEKIYQVAKTLIWALHNHCKEGRHKLTNQLWTQSEYDRSREAYRKSQDKEWEKVLKDNEALRQKVVPPHQLVLVAKDNVAHARGEDSHKFGHRLGMGLTEDQKMVAHVWSDHLRHEFNHAEKQFNELCGEPFGILTRIDYLEQKRYFNLGIVPPTDM